MLTRITGFFSLLFLSGNIYSQQLARATDVQMVTEAGTKIVMTGGITFKGTSNWVNNGETHIYKTTVSSPEGWLDSTSAPNGVLSATSTGNVFFRGNQRQSFYGKTRFYDLTIRNTAGDTLLSSCEVRNILNLDTGFVFTRTGYGNDSLWVSNPAINAIASTSNFTESWVNGRLSRSGNVIGSLPTFYLFPVGKTDSLYAPVRLEKGTANLAVWTVEYFPDTPFNHLNVLSPPIDHISRVEYWEMTGNAVSDASARVSLSWRGYSRVSNDPAVRDSLIVTQYILQPPFMWGLPGGWVTGMTTGADSLAGYVRSNAFNGFSYDERRFTLGTNSKYNGLPVKLIYFNAIADGNKVRLDWEAANEQDTRTYEIERSLNAINFTQLATVSSRQLALSAYTGYDLNPVMGWNYYRLKIIDRSGSYFYSPVRPVRFDKGLEQVKLFPNPASDVLNIQLPSSYVNESIINIYGVDGKFMVSRKPSANIVVLNVLPLPSGTYIIQITKTNGTKETYRFVKQ